MSCNKINSSNDLSFFPLSIIVLFHGDKQEIVQKDSQLIVNLLNLTKVKKRASVCNTRQKYNYIYIYQ